tara:strand:- start:10812 stop:11297 length:486 start_codon:yes stop_codon:yes gene_type:complete
MESQIRMITIGKVKNVNQATKGLLIYNSTDNPKRFESGQVIYFADKEYTIVRSSRSGSKETFLWTDPAPTDICVGAELSVPYSSVEVLDSDTFYHDDLIGIEVYQGSTLLGEITEIIETGSNDVYVVTGVKSETLIPALKPVIKSIDIGRGIMLVELPKGL